MRSQDLGPGMYASTCPSFAKKCIERNKHVLILKSKRCPFERLVGGLTEKVETYNQGRRQENFQGGTTKKSRKIAKNTAKYQDKASSRGGPPPPPLEEGNGKKTEK